MKTRKILSMLMISLMAIFLAACGGDAPGGDNAGGGDNADASSAVSLSQTETIEVAELGGSITFSYPEGWALQNESGSIIIANNADALTIQDPTSVDEIPTGTVLISLSILPGEMLGSMGLEGDVTPKAVIDRFAGFTSGDDMPEFGEVEEVTIGGKAAAKSSGRDDKLAATVYVYAVDNGGNFTFAIGETRTDEAGANSATIEAIVASVTFTASE